MLDWLSAKKTAVDGVDGSDQTHFSIKLNGQEIQYGPETKGAWKGAAEIAKATNHYDGLDLSTTAGKKLMYKHELMVNGTPETKAQQMADDRFGITETKTATQSKTADHSSTAANKKAATSDHDRPGREFYRNRYAHR